MASPGEYRKLSYEEQDLVKQSYAAQAVADKFGNVNDLDGVDYDHW